MTVEVMEAGPVWVITELTGADAVATADNVEVTEMTVEVVEAGTLLVAPMITTEDGILSTTVAYPVAS